MSFPLEAETAGAGDVLVAVWVAFPSSAGLLGEAGSLVGNPAAALAADIYQALQNDYNLAVVKVPKGYVAQHGGTYYVGATLRVLSGGDGIPYQQLLQPVNPVYDPVYGPAVLAFADYADITESGALLAQQIANADNGLGGLNAIGDAIGALWAAVKAPLEVGAGLLLAGVGLGLALLYLPRGR